jgi:hypothetical protein
MKRAIFLLTIILACAIDRHVTLLLGPTATQPSSGFRCPDPNDPTSSLFGRSAAMGKLRFNLVVDLIDVGQHVPSCVGEDILASCADGTCKPTTAAAPKRYCMPIAVDAGTPAAVAQSVLQALQGSAITSEAPHHPVIVRAVATMDDCAQHIQVANNGVWAPLDASQVLGCAYSCPVDLDTIDGDVSLGIGIDLTMLSPTQCVTAIDACAAVGN